MLAAAAGARKATAILQNLSGYVQQYVWTIAADTTVQSDFTGGGSVQTAVTDAHIATAVASIFNPYI